MDRLHQQEKDLWELLELFMRADLFYDINDEKCQISLQNHLNSISVHATSTELINSCYLLDDRLRKGKIILEWLETCAKDRVQDIPVPSVLPWSETASIIRSRKPSSIKSLHPDAQISSDFHVMPLHGDDAYDQENLLRAIWQLIRSGQIERARELAVQQNVFWLAAVLLGGMERDHVQSEESNVVTAVGNFHKPLWIQNCWKYCEKLAGNSNNLYYKRVEDVEDVSGQLVGSYETAIYAALSNHYDVLSKSGLVAGSWTERLWAAVKCLHGRDLAILLLHHRERKAAHSSLFPGPLVLLSIR